MSLEDDDEREERQAFDRGCAVLLAVLLGDEGQLGVGLEAEGLLELLDGLGARSGPATSGRGRAWPVRPWPGWIARPLGGPGRRSSAERLR